MIEQLKTSRRLSRHSLVYSIQVLVFIQVQYKAGCWQEEGCGELAAAAEGYPRGPVPPGLRPPRQHRQHRPQRRQTLLPGEPTTVYSRQDDIPLNRGSRIILWVSFIVYGCLFPKTSGILMFNKT